MEGIRKINTARSPKTPRDRTSSPTFEQLLQGDASKWPSCSSPAQHHEQEDCFAHQNKKSVFTKVKEKAKKLKHSLSKKKHGHEDTGSPPSPLPLDDENSPEYLGAPMYESEQAPEACKETAREHPRLAIPIISEKHILTSNIAAESENKDQIQKETKKETMYQSKSNPESQNYAKITETKLDNFSGNEMRKFEQAGKQTWDKGVSVKEYLMQKLEPGEDERALSQAITEAISPRKVPAGREMSMVDKVREAVTSLLRNEETASSSSSQAQPIVTSSSPPIPISTHPQTVAEEENHGRVLQAN